MTIHETNQATQHVSIPEATEVATNSEETTEGFTWQPHTKEVPRKGMADDTPEIATSTSATKEAEVTATKPETLLPSTQSPDQFTELQQPITGSEVLSKQRHIDEITSEIQSLKLQVAGGFLKIGKCLLEAKAQLGHGEWLDWLRNRAVFSERMAQEYMRLAREYSDTKVVSDLGFSKAQLILSLPADEREAFALEAHEINGKEKRPVEMTNKELATVVRDYKKQKTETASKGDEKRTDDTQQTAFISSFNKSCSEVKRSVETAFERLKEAKASYKPDDYSNFHSSLRELLEDTLKRMLELEPDVPTEEVKQAS